MDYYVGVPAGAELRDPSVQANLPAGAETDPTNHLVRIVADNVTLDGFDFSLHGGWGVYIANGAWTGTIVQNSNFMVGTNNVIPVSAAADTGELTVQYNTFDGGGTTSNGNSNSAWTMVSYSGSGKFLAQYNVFKNAPKDGIEFANATVQPTLQYNVFFNLGTSSGAHSQAYEYVGGLARDGVDQFNTTYQPVGGGEVTGNEGVQIAAQRQSNLSDLTVQYDTIIAPGPTLTMSASIAILLERDHHSKIDTVNVRNNYLDFTGAYYAIYPLAAGGGVNLHFNNNVNLVTGAIVGADGSGARLPGP